MKLLKITCLFFLMAISGCSSDSNSNSNTIENGVNKAPNQKATGSSANDLLAATKYNKLVIEILYVKNFKPATQTITNLQNFLAARLNKPGGIVITQREINPTGFSPYDINEIVSLENAYRTKYNNGTTIALYMFFADGNASGDTSTSFTLGSAYRNTSFVIYENTIKNNSGGIGQPTTVNLETTVILHEMCHLLGLVNLGSPMQTPHLDFSHDKHCNDDTCLMYWEAENNGALSMILGGVPDLDTNCLNDLIANGGK
ncbi:membrane metalloprotease [Flavobacterium amnicola]|uniref:Membrane metalloprotease n=1 Tax=Flavobacterium amnicola TaxID=2506422 RepID=A0A4Q1K7C7_9FLAO|nr:membrane metalloprotease [Flavobacterium amnicola]RXR21385.1 membrane metalloprotease [Flavobacterium amnicola]